MKIQLLPLLGLLILFAISVKAQDHPWSSARPDGHAPLGVMGDHYHHKGEFMVSYRYMPMWMEGNIASTSDIADDEVYKDYMVAPQTMRMDMHMLGAMYAPSDRLTLMVMFNYLNNTMTISPMMGTDFNTSSAGFGDMSVSGLIKILNKNRQSLHANIGVSLPTGDIDQRGKTPMSEDAIFGYPMQLGSGTWDPSFGLTYLGQAERISWGLQSKYKFRIGENSAQYTLGNRFDAVGWGAIKLSQSFSFSGSLSYEDTQKIEGANEEMHPMMMPLFDTNNSGRSQLDVGLGLNYSISKGSFKNLRLATEVKLPVYQKAKGIQMKNTLLATFGIQYSM